MLHYTNVNTNLHVTVELFTFFNVIPELVLAGAFLKSFWEFHWARAEVPEKDPKGVDINRIIILSCQQKKKP